MHKKVSYTVDKNDKLIEFSSNWDEVAHEGDAPELAAQNIAGKPLRNFVVGNPAQMYVDVVFEFARLKKEPVVKTYRCDTPQFKRNMQMTVTPKPNGDVETVHEVLSIEPWEKELMIDNSRAKEGKGDLKLYDRCSVCNDIFYEDKWLTQDDIAVLNPSFEKEPMWVTYTVCPFCKNKLNVK